MEGQEKLSDAGKWIIKNHIEELSKMKSDHELIKWLDGIVISRIASETLVKNYLKNNEEKDL